VIGVDLGTANSAVAEIIEQADVDRAPEARCLDVEQPARQGPQQAGRFNAMSNPGRPGR